MLVSGFAQQSNFQSTQGSNIFADIINRGFDIVETHFGRNDSNYVAVPPKPDPGAVLATESNFLGGILSGGALLLIVAAIAVYFLFFRK